MVMRTKPTRPPPSREAIAISMRGLVNVLGGTLIHDHVDLDVKRGEVLGVVGGSGSGKSVLLRTIIGLQKPVEGDIRVLGEPIGQLQGRDLRALQMRWGVLFQEGALFGSQTVAENIQVPLREYTGMDQQLMDEISSMKIAMVGLPEDTAQKYPSELSGGMKKRAGLARAMALDPSILLVDEPSAGLDPITASEIDELLVETKRNGTTLVVVTHNIPSARIVGDDFGVLHEGRLLARGTIEDLDASDEPIVQAFMRSQGGG